MREFKSTTIAKSIAAALTATTVAGCGTLQPEINRMEATTVRNIEVEQARAAQPVPVVTKTSDAWLLGQPLQVKPTPSPLLLRNVIYRPTQRITLADVAAYITQETGLIVDTAEMSPQTGATSMAAGGAPAPSGATPFTPPSPPTTSPTVPAISAFAGAGVPSAQQNGNAPNGLPWLHINHTGSVSSLADIAANKSGGWWKFSEGRLVFFRTESKTFYLPAITRKSTGTSSITANSGASESAAGGSTTGTSSGAASTTSEYAVDVWGEIEKTAKAVAVGAQVVGNASVGSITVMGTPTQIRNVEEWVKSLSDNLSQQVALTVHIYKVKLNNEDNYNWNPSVLFSTVTNKYGLSLTGPQSPATTSGNAPLNFVASVLDTATGRAGQFSGSQLAFQALSTLGRVSETLNQTVVTLNGQPAPIQVANQTTYLASTSQSQTAVGQAPLPPTLTPGTITTGFTAMFLPRIVNGKILLTMNLTSSSLLGISTVASGGSSIQTPNVDINTFQQSVTLTPGDSLMLTGLQSDQGATNHSGVGSPSNFVLGGGIGNTTGKQLIAIVISAKVL